MSNSIQSSSVPSDKGSMRVLFVSYMAPCFNEFYPLVLEMKRAGLFEPVVYFNHDKEQASHQIDVCLRDDVIALYQSGQRAAIGESEIPIANTPREKGIPDAAWAVNIFFRGMRRLSYEAKRINSAMRPLSFFDELFHLLLRRKVINKLLTQHCIKGVVLGFDMAGRDTGLIIKECHNLGIPVVTMTWILASGDDPAHAYQNKKVYPELQASRFLNRLLVLCFPKYLYSYHGVELVRLPATKAIWHELLGIGAPLPWVFNSGRSDSIIVDSQVMYHFYEKAGIPSEQLALTGMPNQDLMARVLMNKDEYKHKLCDEYGLDYRKPILLTGYPSDIFYMREGIAGCEFASHEEIMEFWTHSIRQLNGKFNIIVTVPPGTSQAERSRLEQIYGIKVINAARSTAEVIPLCDLYITCASSTMRWAVACGLPVVDYRAYDFGDGEVLPGMACVKKKSDFLAILNRLLADDNYLPELMQRQKSAAGDYGTLDGKACKRISELLEKHIEAYNKKNQMAPSFTNGLK